MIGRIPDTYLIPGKGVDCSDTMALTVGDTATRWIALCRDSSITALSKDSANGMNH